MLISGVRRARISAHVAHVKFWGDLRLAIVGWVNLIQRQSVSGVFSHNRLLGPKVGLEGEALRSALRPGRGCNVFDLDESEVVAEAARATWSPGHIDESISLRATSQRPGLQQCHHP